MKPNGPAHAARCRLWRRDERGETLPLLIIWPTLLVSIMLLALHAFILSNAQAEASLAASKGLRAAWRAAAEANLGDIQDQAIPDPNNPPPPPVASETLPLVAQMASAARAAVATSAAGDAQSWRWWSNDVTQVSSDWCDQRPRTDPNSELPDPGEAGWVRVTVSGEVLGPLTALWPDRLDRVYAVAEGPARFVSNPAERETLLAPRAGLPACP